MGYKFCSDLIFNRYFFFDFPYTHCLNMLRFEFGCHNLRPGSAAKAVNEFIVFDNDTLTCSMPVPDQVIILFKGTKKTLAGRISYNKNWRYIFDIEFLKPRLISLIRNVL